MRQRPSLLRRSHRRPGVTLLELIVVLALLGLVLAIAAPAFITPEARGKSDLSAVVAAARRAAVLRGEPVTLTVEAAGVWRIEGDATVGPPPIATGTLETKSAAIRLRVSALGVCVPDPVDGVVSRSWNAIGCGAAGATNVAATP